MLYLNNSCNQMKKTGFTNRKTKNNQKKQGHQLQLNPHVIELEVLSLRAQMKAILNLLYNTSAPDEQHKIAIPNRYGYDFISIHDILYCKAEGAYTNIILSNKKLLLSRSLGETMQMLPVHLFERVHHSLLVNIKRIASYSKADGCYILMDNGDQLSVSRTRKEQLLTRLGVK
jgi:two-component system, LytTR family, response regulator